MDDGIAFNVAPIARRKSLFFAFKDPWSVAIDGSDLIRHVENTGYPNYSPAKDCVGCGSNRRPFFLSESVQRTEVPNTFSFLESSSKVPALCHLQHGRQLSSHVSYTVPGVLSASSSIKTSQPSPRVLWICCMDIYVHLVCLVSSLGTPTR